MEGENYLYKEVLPFAAIFTLECINVGVSTLYKAASLKGMNYFSYIFYCYALSAICLFPFAYFSHRKANLSPLKISILFQMFLLGIIGFLAQRLGYLGIEYSSPTLASAMSNLTPACTFILAVIFRMENLSLRNLRSLAKIIGTIISIAGAIIVIFYKGRPLTRTSHNSISVGELPSSSSQDGWIIGGLLNAASYALAAVWFILQARVLKEYPAGPVVTFFFSLSLTIISAPVSLIAEHNPSAWKLRPDISLVAVLYTGIVGYSLGVLIQTWGVHFKGPFYVASFRPLSIAIAAIAGVIFLGDTLYLGSVVGATTITIGFYLVIWAKSKEESCEETTAKTPLLATQSSASV